MKERDYILVGNKTTLMNLQSLAGNLMAPYGLTEDQKRTIYHAIDSALSDTFKAIRKSKRTK